MPTAPDHSVYAWFEARRRPAYYSLLFARRLSPREVLRRLAAPAAVHLLTAAERDICADSRDLVDVHALDGWTLAVELDGFDAYLAQAVRRLSAETEAVVLTYNVLAHCRFLHVVDGTTWTHFDAADPSHRWGFHPDRLVDAMRQVGLDPNRDLDDDLDDGEPLNWCSKTLALAEFVTGTRLFPDTFIAAPALSARIAFEIER